MNNHTVFGAGAMGHLLAALLTTGQVPTTLLHRPTSRSDNLGPIVLRSESGIKQLKIASQSSDASPPIDILWLAVKAYQVEEALESIKSHLHPQSWLILLQNGMGNLELATRVVQQQIPANQIMAVANTHAAYLDKSELPVTIHHTGVGRMAIGLNYLAEKPEEKPDFITDLPASLNISWTDDLQETLWLKLAINAVINPITAHYQCRNGDLLTQATYQSEVEQLISELEQFFSVIEQPRCAAVIRHQCHEVIRQTAANYSSMMLDVKHGRATEIDAISGYLLNVANRFRLSMTGHQMQYHRLLNT